MTARKRFPGPVPAVVAVTVLSLLLRIVDLGTRIAHWDEGRVAYWVLRYAETGVWSYRPIIHGPFVQHAARVSFELFGASDFTARLPVALVGGLLPLAALLFRDWLDDSEITALALVLALNPLLLYFSRFFRSDVPLAAFMFVALGCGLRAVATGRTRYVYVGVAALACGFAAKENAVLYPVAWGGAAGLVAVHTLYHSPSPRSRLVDWGRQLRASGRGFVGPLCVAPIEFLVLTVLFYAPRTAGGGSGLWAVFEQPAVVPAVVTKATVGSARKLVSLWVTGGLHSHPYVPFLGHFVAVLVVGALPTIALAGYGCWTSRKTPTGTLAQFCGWWGLASVVGYPYAADIKAPWLAVHAVIAFAVPASVGLAAMYRRATRALERGDLRRARRVVLVVLLLGAHVGAVAVLTSYTHPTLEANFIAQGAQPGGDLRPALRDVEHIAETHQGEDVLYYGRFATRNEQVNAAPPAGAGWYRRLPFGWYTAAFGANVTNARDPGGLGANPPPVVIAPASAREELDGRLEGYAAFEYAHTRIGEVRTYSVFGYEYTYEGQSVVFFIDRSALARDTGAVGAS